MCRMTVNQFNDKRIGLKLELYILTGVRYAHTYNAVDLLRLPTAIICQQKPSIEEKQYTLRYKMSEKVEPKENPAYKATLEISSDPIKEQPVGSVVPTQQQFVAVQGPRVGMIRK